MTRLVALSALQSTLANALLGDDRLATGSVRALDQRGRHTTTWRELVMLPGGALLIDTPGIREIELWDADDGLSAAFADVEEVAAQCRFGDCTHRAEPGCAIRAALKDGSLPAARYESWTALQRELAYQARRQLWGGTPNHGLDDITQGTNFGTQHFFSPDAFGLATWLGPQ
jgi:ribosome biogenesis GTPase / thiamine phosphate phosphatase